MGNWILTIEGIGPHHNGKPDLDIDLIAQRIVKELQIVGQTINDASLHYGGKTELDTGHNHSTCCDPGFARYIPPVLFRGAGNTDPDEATIKMLKESAAAQDRQTQRMKELNKDRAGKLGFDTF